MELEEEVRMMVRRSTEMVEKRMKGASTGSEEAAQLDQASVPYLSDESIGATGDTNRRPIRLLAAAALVLVAGVAGLSALASDDSGPDNTGGSPVADQDADPQRPADTFDEAIAAIEGPVALPEDLPPDIEYVRLYNLNGQQFLTVEHGDVGVHVCSEPVCAHMDEVYRRFDVNGQPFVMGRVSTTKEVDEGGDGPALPAHIREFWDQVTWVHERPSWLTADMEPGTVRDSPYEVEGNH